MENPANDPNNEVIDPPADEVKDPPAPPPAATQDQIEKTNEILKSIQERLKPADAPAPDQDKVRSMIKEKTGLSDAGVDWVIQMNRESVVAAVAPIQEELGFNRIKASKADSAYPVTPEIEKAMQEELKQYPVHMRGDQVLLEKIYYVEVGKAAAKGKPPVKSGDEPNPVIRRTIVNNNPNPAGNSSQVSSGGSSKLTDQEKDVARKMGVSEVDYAKAKASPVVWEAPAKV